MRALPCHGLCDVAVKAEHLETRRCIGRLQLLRQPASRETAALTACPLRCSVSVDVVERQELVSQLATATTYLPAELFHEPFSEQPPVLSCLRIQTAQEGRICGLAALIPALDSIDNAFSEARAGLVESDLLQARAFLASPLSGPAQDAGVIRRELVAVDAVRPIALRLCHRTSFPSQAHSSRWRIGCPLRQPRI